MKVRTYPLLAAALLGAGAAPAAEAPAAVQRAIAGLMPGVEPNAIAPAPVQGLYEVVIGPRLFYVSTDGKYLIDGDVIDVAARSNVSESRRDGIRAAAIDGLGEEGMIVYTPKKVSHTVTVFTDIDCPYCRRMHEEIDAYLERGIRVRYLAYPRAGVDTPSYDKAVEVWCAKDRQRALTQAKRGEPVASDACDSPVQRHMAMGQLIGLRGTPTIILEDGRMLPGYVPADRLGALLESE